MALQADGWVLRQTIAWAKPNPLPESVRDRCTKAHEYLFLLAKSARYHFDADAIAEPTSAESIERDVQRILADRRKEYSQDHQIARRGVGATPAKGFTGDDNEAAIRAKVSRGRNRRSVWTVAPEPYPGAHFAVMPPELVRPCVLAGCPAGGLVIDPFAGSGTTLAVAVEEGRRAAGCDLNPEYVALARERMATVTPSMFSGAE